MSTTSINVEEWKQLADDVAVISTNQAVMQAEITTMKRQHDEHHKLLVGDETSPGLKTLMYSMNSNLRLIKWLIGVLIAGLTLYFGIREAEHRSMAEREMPQISTSAHIPHLAR